MASRIECLTTAASELAAPARADQQRMAGRVDALRETPRPRGARMLERTGGQRLYRIRVGDDGVIDAIDATARVVLVIRIGHRREVSRER